MNYSPLPPLEELQETYAYDPSDRYLRWKVASRCGRKKPGDPAGRITRCPFYVRIKGQMYVTARVIWYLHTGQDPGQLLVDHVNGDQSDNRFVNLRLATSVENSANRGTNPNRSLPRGIVYRRNKYHARIGEGGRISVGVFDDLGQAVEAWQTKAKEIYGQFGIPRDLVQRSNP